MSCKTVSSPYCSVAYAKLAGCLSRRRAVATSNVLSSNGAKLCIHYAPTSQPEAEPPSLFSSDVHARAELAQCYSKRLFRKQTMHRAWVDDRTFQGPYGVESRTGSVPLERVVAQGETHRFSTADYSISNPC